MKTCDDCGSRVYNGHCVSCDEGYFIAQQETEDAKPEIYIQNHKDQPQVGFHKP